MFFPRGSSVRWALLSIALVAGLVSRNIRAAEPPGIIRSAGSGPWSDPASWEGGKVPPAGARVQVRQGHIVVYNVKAEHALRSLHIAGTLTFAPDRDTQLDVGLIKIQGGDDYTEDGFNCDAHSRPGSQTQFGNQTQGGPPALEVGTPERPIDAKHRALIRLVYFDGMDKESCPAIVCCGGRMDFHGAPLSCTWVKLGATARPGDAEVTLAEPVRGWRAGDRVIVTGTKPRRFGGGKRGRTNVFTEERIVRSIEKARLVFDKPLEHEHLGTGAYCGEAANLSRNVVVESADPSQARGHTMYHRRSTGAISFAEFRHLGKEGVLGKYPLHFHLAGDTMRGSYVLGASIWDSGNRWLTVHGTNYLVVRDCVGYRSVGHGFFFEDGTEVYNVVDRNLAVQAFTGKPLPKQVLPFDQNEGAGFWWANSLNTFTGNVACENDRYGYRFEATQTSRLKLTLPVQQPDGSRRSVDIRTLPFIRFDGNESHHEGLYGFNLGEGVERVGPDIRHPFIVRNTKIWGTHYAFRPQVPSLLVEGMQIWRAEYGVYHPNYENHVYRDLYIGQTNTEPFNRGHDDISKQFGVLTVDGLTFDGIRSGDFMPLVQISDDNPTGAAVSHLRNVKLTNWTGSKQRALVNRGGGPRPEPTTPKGVPVYLHDWFGPGRHAKVVSTKTRELKEDGESYRAEPLLTGDESRMAEVRDVAFPRLLDPIDDLPPVTVITDVRKAGGKLAVRGTASDNGIVKRVLVNHREARALHGNFAEWEVVLDEPASGVFRVEAYAEDVAGNVEKQPHVVTVNNRAVPDGPKTHRVGLNGHRFTLPAGFEIELVAGPPLVDRPIVADFDEQGRLYVADSSGTNENIAQQLVKKPHRIVRLESTTANGRYDRRTVFADKMMFPEGVMCYAGSVYVAAPPSIWKLTDTKGEGVADQRVEWFQGKSLTGCANDLHGPYLGPDGWIYWCKGAFAKQTYERPGRTPFVTRAAHIFRCRPDGTGIEPVMTGGMDNPVDVVFMPGGERIFTTTFFQHPGGGRRDGLIHAVYGGIYGKDHDPIYEHPWTGPALMPVLTHMGAAAPCGLTRYESRVFGPEYQDNLFACQFNMHKVSRHVLEPDGATFKCRDEDFLVSDNADFHPTDVLEDADGSLLVIDTGGWYKLCCPSSQLHKPDILGAIYRIRRRGVTEVTDPRGLKLAWDTMTAQELAGLFNDARPAVRRRAIQALAEKDGDSVRVLAKTLQAAPAVEARRNIVWAATRLDHPDARTLVREALADADESVRQAAIHSISVWRDRAAVAALLPLLKNPSLQNRRAAAEALGRIGDKAAVPALVAAFGEPGMLTLGGTPDRALEHSLTFALIEIGDRNGTAEGLRSANVHARRAALIALDQMTGGKLEVAVLARELGSPDVRMKETASWIAGRHPEWGGALAGFLRERLAAKSLTEAEGEELAGQFARFARTGSVQDLLAGLLRDPAALPETRRIALRAMARANLKEPPDAWVAEVIQVLGDKDNTLVGEAVAAVRAWRVPRQKAEKLFQRLISIGTNPDAPAQLRLSALAAVSSGLPKVESALFDFLRSHLTPDKPAAIRSLAVDVLARAQLNSEQLSILIQSLQTIGPMEVDRLLEAFAQSTDETVGTRLIAALNAAPVKAGLRVQMIKPRLAKYPASVQKQAEALYASLNVDAEMQRAKLEEMLASLKEGDIRRGQTVFNSSKAACAACHAIGYLGGNVGPDLTHIGKIRTDRDLLEAIVFPSASIVRSYEPVGVATKAGKFINGLIRKDSPEEIVLATGPNQEVRIARSDIEEIQPSKISIMPAGLDQQLTVRELADLVAFLRACK